MTELEQAKESERQLQDDFLAACVAVLAAAHQVGEAAESVKHAGGQPVEILHMADVVAACRQLLNRSEYQARRAGHDAEKAAIKARQKLGKTYGLK